MKKAPGRRVHDQNHSSPGAFACLSTLPQALHFVRAGETRRHRSVQPHFAASLRSSRRSPPSDRFAPAWPDLRPAGPARPGPPAPRRHLCPPCRGLPHRDRHGLPLHTRGRRPAGRPRAHAGTGHDDRPEEGVRDPRRHRATNRPHSRRPAVLRREEEVPRDERLAAPAIGVWPDFRPTRTCDCDHGRPSAVLRRLGMSPRWDPRGASSDRLTEVSGKSASGQHES